MQETLLQVGSFLKTAVGDVGKDEVDELGYGISSQTPHDRRQLLRTTTETNLAEDWTIWTFSLLD